MKVAASSVAEYLAALPPERRAVVESLRKAVRKGLPKGFVETLNYGMVGFVVPHSLYPAGYHCAPQLPLPFIAIAAQKNFYALYHMGMYADAKLLAWWTAAHAKASPVKLDMGKSCVRYKKAEHIPLALVTELAKKQSPAQWIAMYERQFKTARSAKL
jgi:hypothetical protein